MGGLARADSTRRRDADGKREPKTRPQFSAREILLRSGKGGKDRVTTLPDALAARLGTHIQPLQALAQEDRGNQVAGAWLPEALARNYPNAGRRVGVAVAVSCKGAVDRSTGRDSEEASTCTRRARQRAVRAATLASGAAKRVTCHTFRHSFATDLGEG
jgi:integrase